MTDRPGISLAIVPVPGFVRCPVCRAELEVALEPRVRPRPGPEPLAVLPIGEAAAAEFVRRHADAELFMGPGTELVPDEPKKD